jgi:hypothetical protein
MATLAHIFFYPFFSIFYFLFTLTRSYRRELKAKQKQKGTLIIDATWLPASNFYLHYLNIYVYASNFYLHYLNIYVYVPHRRKFTIMYAFS